MKNLTTTLFLFLIFSGISLSSTTDTRPMLGVRTVAIAAPVVCLYIPSIDDPSDRIELGIGFYRFFSDSTVLIADYRKRINFDQDNRFYISLGILYNSYKSYTFFNSSVAPGSTIFPLIGFEWEKPIDNNLSFSVYAGFPEILGIGIKTAL